MGHPYKDKCSSFNPIGIFIFQHNLQARFAQVLRLYCGRNRSLAFTTIHDESFPLPHYCGISDLPSAASVNYDSSVPQNQFFYSCCIHFCAWCAWLNGSINIMHVCSTVFEIFAPIFDTLLPHYTITICLHQLAVKFAGC